MPAGADLLVWAAVIPIAFVAGTIGGAVGFGSAVLLVPVCVWAFGADTAIPVLTLAALIGNVSRAGFSIRETDWRAVGVYSVCAVPAAACGAFIFVALDVDVLHRLLGLFILLMVPAARYAARMKWRVRLWHLAPVGAAMGLLSGVVGTAGPVNAPFFLAYGLVKGAYLATEALGAAAVHATKGVVYGRFSLLEPATIQAGLIIGAALIAGSWAGKQIIDRLDPARFRSLVEIAMVIAGLVMLAGY